MAAAADQRWRSEIASDMVSTPLLQRVPKAAVGRLVSLGRVRQYRRGTYIFYQGDPSEQVFFLWKGRVQTMSLSLSGHRQLHTTLEPGQFFGELGVLGDQPRTATAFVVEEAAVWVASADVFVEFLGHHFEAARALLRGLARQIQAHESFVEDLLFLDLKGRVAKRLLQLVSPSLDELPPDGTIVPSVVTHADLASLCGGSRENVTRILSEFQRRGLVARDGHRYLLRNVAGLGRMAGL
ncbi:MAG TPA: Crp/Fnr family transcriptional regulator [Actinomycetota bacterium]|nr:Crp/Fnr family transcriptional regulator [Actinomycetota bacterium]